MELPDNENLEIDPFQDVELKDHSNTSCEHEYALDDKQDPNTNLLSVRCVKCPAGISIDGDEFEIYKGKVVTK